MFLTISLTAILTLAAGLQEGAPAVAPVVGEEVAAVVALDLTKLDVSALLRAVLGKDADEAVDSGAMKAAVATLDALKRAGAKELFVLVDPADIPGKPVVAVPLPGGADAKAITDALTQKSAENPFHWPAAETIRGVVVAGTPEALARIRKASPAQRPDLAAALGDERDAPIRIVVIPSPTQRRSLEEAMPNLPAELGSAPVTTLTRGLRWGLLALQIEPHPTLHAVWQARDANAAEDVAKVIQDLLKLLANQAGKRPDLAPLGGAVGQLKPKVHKDRITLDADLKEVSALVSVPVRQAQEAARRAQCTNNLKQIALAMHNYHSAHGTFPPAYSTSKDGKPLLSWRVQILPFLDQQALYEEFHLDEPWDSPHNKQLISKMPRLYACPDAARQLTSEGKTTYLTPRGPATVFPGAEGIKIQEITDGTVSTIMVVDAADDLAVPWTKPDDWEVAPQLKTQGLFGHHTNGTNFAFADGSVRFLKDTIATKLLQALVTRNGGEVVSLDGE